MDPDRTHPRRWALSLLIVLAGLAAIYVVAGVDALGWDTGRSYPIDLRLRWTETRLLLAGINPNLQQVAKPLGLPMPAQVETARIIGTVKDPTGALIPAASITITNVETNISTSTTTHADGSYESVPLRIGSYRVSAGSSGFKHMVREGIVLQIQQTAVVDFTLEVGQITQDILVTGSAPLLTVNEAAQGQVIDNQKVVDLPLNGRDYIQLALLSAGANESAPGSPRNGRSYRAWRKCEGNPNSSTAVSIPTIPRLFDTSRCTCPSAAISLRKRVIVLA